MVVLATIFMYRPLMEYLRLVILLQTSLQAVFSTYLYTNTELNGDLINSIAENCKSAWYKKNEFLLRQGDICRQVFFVEQGLLRQYSIDEKGKEHILYFAPENWLVADRESIFFNEPGSYFIQALEDSKVTIIDQSFINNLAERNPSFLTFNNRLLHNHIRHLQKRITQLLSATAEERYLDFTKIYPDILLRVPQAMVASYLGITPESLSRVRKDLAQKHFKP